jgi:hypothetical protein
MIAHDSEAAKSPIGPDRGVDFGRSPHAMPATSAATGEASICSGVRRRTAAGSALNEHRRKQDTVDRRPWKVAVATGADVHRSGKDCDLARAYAEALIRPSARSAIAILRAQYLDTHGGPGRNSSR